MVFSVLKAVFFRIPVSCILSQRFQPDRFGYLPPVDGFFALISDNLFLLVKTLGRGECCAKACDQSVSEPLQSH